MSDQKQMTTQVQDMVLQLCELNRTKAECQYDTGRLLTAIIDNKLYEFLKYKNFAELCYYELPYQAGTATRYITLYRAFRMLKYNKKECIDLIERFGVTSLANTMPKFDRKIGVRAIANRVDDYIMNRHQMNIMLDDDQYQRTMSVFRSLGLEESKNGRCKNLSETFIEALEALERDKRDNRLKSVA